VLPSILLACCLAQISTPIPNNRPFYDKVAKIELGATVALTAADLAMTCDNLAHGGHEDWLPTQKCGTVIGIEIGGLALQEVLAYELHKRHHYKLERLVRLYLVQDRSRAIAYSWRHHGY
jgi:hypothetical protein